MSDFLERQDEKEENISLNIKSGVSPLIARVNWYIRDRIQLYYSKPLDEDPVDISDNSTGQVSCTNLPDIEYGKSSAGLERHRRFIKFYSLPNIFRRHQEPDACPLRNFLCHCLFVYLLIKLTSFSSMSYYMLKLLQTWSPRVRLAANRTERCALRQDIEEEYDGSASLYISLREYMMGYGVRNVYSAQIVSYVIFATSVSAVTLYLGAIFHGKDTIYLDTLSFQLNPIEERARIRKKLVSIVQNLYKTADYACLKLKETNSDFRRSCIYRRPDVADVAALRPKTYLRAQQYHGSNCRCVNDSQKRLKFVKFIFQERLIDHIWPAHLTLKFYDDLIPQEIGFAIIQIMFMTVAMIGMMVFSNYDEINLRVRNRIELYRCEIWNQNATLIRDVVGMNRRPLPNEQKELYINHIMNPSNEIGNLLLIETIEIFKWPAILRSLEFFIFYGATMNWTFNYVWAFFMGNLTMTKWLEQIQDQMDKCLRLIDCHLNQYENIIEAQQDPEVPPKDDIQAQERRRDVERALTITYLNFELFRQEYKYFKDIINFLVFHLVPLVTLNSLLSYISITLINQNIGTLWVLHATYIMTLNVFVSICVSILSRVHKLYNTITRILIKSSSASMELTQIVRLWRRQLLNDGDVKSYYGIKVIGGNVSPSTLLAVDSYVMALWLTMGRQLGYI